jgi:glycogen synthase
LSHDYFSITIHSETFGLDMIEEDYKLVVTSSIGIALFARTAEKGMSLLLKVIGVLLKKIEGNSIFLGDSSTLILTKVDNKIFVYNNPEEYFFNISFDNLGEGYDIICVQ